MSLEDRVTRLESIVIEAGEAAANIAKLAAQLRRLLKKFDVLASGLGMAASHLEDVLRRLT